MLAGRGGFVQGVSLGGWPPPLVARWVWGISSLGTPRSGGSDHPNISFAQSLRNRGLNPACFRSWGVFVFH